MIAIQSHRGVVLAFDLVFEPPVVIKVRHDEDVYAEVQVAKGRVTFMQGEGPMCNVWAKGFQLKTDGTVGKRRRNIDTTNPSAYGPTLKAELINAAADRLAEFDATARRWRTG